MGIYISYYGNYVSIVEGTYNNKKLKYNIKSIKSISTEDVELNNNDKYALLREALGVIDSKNKNIVLSLNTRDVIIKSNQMPKMQPKDLDGVMNNEMYEMMSLHDEQYTFSYEVTNETQQDGKQEIDVIMAAISNNEIEIIMNIFKEYKLNLIRIDTISTAYARLLNHLEYEDIMAIDVGSYGSIVNIYKNDSLFIHDNIPVKINKNSNKMVAIALAEEVRGLTNFYASRNFGKAIDKIVLLGESNENKILIDYFEEKFAGEVVQGIENLINIEKDIQGNISRNEISKIASTLGSMSIYKTSKKDYSYMNLLPKGLRRKKDNIQNLKKVLIMIPLVATLLYSPKLVFSFLQNQQQEKLNIANTQLEEILLKYKDIESINQDIALAKEEIGIYDMLESNEIEWGKILTSIDKNIPYRVDLTNISIAYDETLNVVLDENGEVIEEDSETIDTDTTEEEVEETPIYEKIPNTITIDGVAQNSEYLGQFMYSLNQVPYFETVKLTNSHEDTENEVGVTFNIVLILEEGVLDSE